MDWTISWFLHTFYVLCVELLIQVSLRWVYHIVSLVFMPSQWEKKRDQELASSISNGSSQLMTYLNIGEVVTTYWHSSQQTLSMTLPSDDPRGITEGHLTEPHSVVQQTQASEHRGLCTYWVFTLKTQCWTVWTYRSISKLSNMINSWSQSPEEHYA